MNWIKHLWLAYKNRGKMEKRCCNSPECKREVRGNFRGQLYVVNHFSCPKVQEDIKELYKALNNERLD
jgi:hypothetical protein